MSNIPYTTAASDFMKKVVFIDDNKPSEIDFAATDFATLRQALINYIKAVYPLDYSNFSESDLGMMLIELVAYMGAVMSMKADMLAHESFLKTAKNINNVRKLLDLIGIRMKGPTSSAAMCTVDSDEIGPHVIEPEARVISKVSAEDGESVSYTLYTTTNGALDNPGTNGEITLEVADSEGGAGFSWANTVLVEGSFAMDAGTFTDVDVIKELTLQQSPVIESSIQVYIDGPEETYGGYYTQVPSLLTVSSSNQKVFEVAYGDNFSAKILFGDGVNGYLPPQGVDYTIMYRVGGGQRGNAKTSFINQAVISNTGKELIVENIKPFTGGANAETIEHAKKYGKLVFKQQDRLVSLEDYVAFVNSFSGPLGTVGKGVAATREAYGSANVIDLYLLEKASETQLQKASVAFKTSMLEEIDKKKMMTDEVVLVDGLIRTVDLAFDITLDSKYRPSEAIISNKIQSIILDFFSVEHREFGERLNLDLVCRDVFSAVEEVRLAEITNFKETIRLEFNEIVQLNNFTLNFIYV